MKKKNGTTALKKVLKLRKKYVTSFNKGQLKKPRESTHSSIYISFMIYKIFLSTSTI